MWTLAARWWAFCRCECGVSGIFSLNLLESSDDAYLFHKQECKDRRRYSDDGCCDPRKRIRIVMQELEPPENTTKLRRRTFEQTT
jgi:hypothetical protein